MPVTVVVGGQFGSEGKGKVARYLAQEQHAKLAIRVGGANSGHTIIDDTGSPRVFRQLPTASTLPGITSIVSAGSYIDVDVFLKEVESCGLSPAEVLVDPLATVIEERHRTAERAQRLRKTIGSTLSGTGAALLDRIARHVGGHHRVRLARDDARLAPFLRHDLKAHLRRALTENRRIIIEGTQGFGLSVLHSPDYPFVTSRDTTAAAFIAEAGLSPLDVDEVVLVIRAYPIRVAGNSGPLPKETSWNQVTANSGAPEPILELSSVTQQVRRVAEFDAEVVRHAIACNNPTIVVMNHVDYVENSIQATEAPSPRVFQFLEEVQHLIERRIDFIGSSPRCLFLCKSNSDWRSRELI